MCEAVPKGILTLAFKNHYNLLKYSLSPYEIYYFSDRPLTHRKHQQQHQHSLLHRRYLSLVSNVCITSGSANVLGPQQTQQTTRNAFQISTQPDWQIDNGFFDKQAIHGA